MQKKNINQLITDYLWGNVSDDDIRYLRQRLTEDPTLAAQYEQLLDSKTLTQRYRQYAQVKEPVRNARRGTSRLVRLNRAVRRLLPYAAVFLCILVGTALWVAYDNRPVKPQLTEEVLAAIEQAEQNGKNQAVLTMGGQQIAVCSEAQINAQTTSGHQQSPVSNSQATTVRDQTLTTHHDSEFWLTLSDGTRVHLNYGTTLTYPVKFTGDTRTVELEGEAYFFVTKDTRHPFVVRTPNGTVTEYGTEFNVDTRDAAGMTRVVLVNGSISVTPTGGAERMMQPGDMAVLSEGKALVSQVDVTPYVSWNTGTFVFADCPLEKLMKVLSHWYNKRVEFDSEETRKIAFTGSVNKYRSIEPALKAIHNVTGLRIEIRNDLIVISRH